MKLSSHQIQDILFLDIETVPLAEDFSKLSIGLQDAITYKYQKSFRYSQTFANNPEEFYMETGGIKSEYSRVICICLAYLKLDKEGKLNIHTKGIGCGFFEESEHRILSEFCKIIDNKFADKNLVLCGHNIQEFDIPFLCRRMLVNGVKIPSVMNFQGKKPWEVKMLDTMNLWKFGDNKSTISLDMLCNVFNIPTPKDTMDGSMIKDTFYKDKNLEKIKTYCINDVIAVVQLLLKYNYLDIVDKSNICNH